ncbi:MAG: hypothetical protein VKN13_02305 [Cyanobacteriota bacterium]|nr:hypothetical protein [Cyanobacteriota bacterium]
MPPPPPVPAPLRAQLPAPPRPDQARPPGLVLLDQRQGREGPEALGVYGARPDPLQPNLWTVKVWLERPNNVQVLSDSIRCGSDSPMRITTDGRRIYVRLLNPGGAINPANRVDHLIWWAVCHPAQAGRDPADLGPLARQLGYSGGLAEREEVLRANPR